MKLKFQVLSMVIIMFIALSSIVTAKEKKIQAPKLNSHAAVVIDQNSGRILYGKNDNKILAMASTTKIITAIVAIENGKLTDQVTVSKKAASINGSSAGLKEGEKVSLEELIYGLMMKSGNDAAIAIAEHIGDGKVENFIKLMNHKALELGLYNTHFVTPHGLDADTHHTTARDLAKATAYALKNKVFQKVSACKEISSGESGAFNKSYNNINKFLFRLPDADGVKTGYTGNAGKCLVASVTHQYGRYIAVTLNSGDRWKDCENLVNYAKENFSHIKIETDSLNILKSRVLGGEEKYLQSTIDKEIYLPVLKGEENNIKTEVQIPSVINSPVYKNDHIGNLLIYVNDKLETTFPFISNKNIENKIYNKAM
ncbi:D-alanyl-D-alanine carboxypeptidase family protein [Clostridium cylindrosporum]|uniref:serine-type D-Ala-D-Ala carboxypeptidase n=1 Tax=Clostridium cylindrosporum DSM 605 TaxID=1121307 RepID=A0A0J8DAN1_CLOCY|nr:D-alanyl-D-alanine carboxypeptidase family protein [Clostridium cylindrosporum]KMT21374.1 D-alanyl-D-alanine carboxypeptidase DacB [Clostridium cylindrosporum DSM 605]